jgi:hypothetical protein
MMSSERWMGPQLRSSSPPLFPGAPGRSMMSSATGGSRA